MPVATDTALPAAIAASDTMAAELVRLRATADEEHLRHRQAVYHDLLNASSYLTETDWRSPRTTEEHEQAKRALAVATHAVELFGTDQARSRGAHLLAAHTSDEADGYDRWRSAVQTARQEFTDVARLDIGPKSD